MSVSPTIIESALSTLAPCSFAPAISKVRAIARDEHCSAKVLTAIIGNDPGMAFLLLSRVNITNNSPDDQPLGISASLHRLGMVSCAALFDELALIPAHLKRPMGACWASAGAAVTMARLLIQRCSASLFTPLLSETALAAAVLYDIGDTVAMRIFGEQYTMSGNRLLAGEFPFHAILADELGASPASLGNTYATLWGLPPAIREAILHQYNPLAHENPRFQPLSCLLHIVRSLVCACGYPSGINHFVEKIDPQVPPLIGLRNTDIIAVIDAFYTEMQHLEYFEMRR